MAGTFPYQAAVAAALPAVLGLTSGGGVIISVAEGQQSSAHIKGVLLGVNVTEGLQQRQEMVPTLVLSPQLHY